MKYLETSPDDPYLTHLGQSELDRHANPAEQIQNLVENTKKYKVNHYFGLQADVLNLVCGRILTPGWLGRCKMVSLPLVGTGNGSYNVAVVVGLPVLSALWTSCRHVSSLGARCG